MRHAQGRQAEKTRDVARQAALGKGRQDEALEAKQGLLVALEQEQGDELLPGGRFIGLEEEAVAVEEIFAGGEEGFKIGIAIDMQVFVQELEDELHATGLAEICWTTLVALTGLYGLFFAGQPTVMWINVILMAGFAGAFGYFYSKK